MLLTVLSALARLDVDPWREAAELAQLPRQTATQRLASLITALPDGPSVHLDSGSIAARLIALLPRGAGSNFPSRETMLSTTDAMTNSRTTTIVFVIFMAFALGAQFIAASRQPSAQVDNAHAPAPSTVIPQIPPPSPDQ